MSPTEIMIALNRVGHSAWTQAEIDTKRPLRPIDRKMGIKCNGHMGTVNLIGRCLRKKHTRRVTAQMGTVGGNDVVAFDGIAVTVRKNSAVTLCLACIGEGHAPDRSSTMFMEGIIGVTNKDIPCNARCLSAKGPSCECSCGGVNHGGAWA